MQPAGPILVSELVEAWRVQHTFRMPLVMLRLAQPLAAQVLLGGIAVCHAVALGLRVCRRRLLVRTEPTAKFLKRFNTDLAMPRCMNSGRPCAQRAAWKNMHDPEIMIEWLAATSNVRDLRKSWGTARSFAQILRNIALVLSARSWAKREL